jgi:hypothetical protein
MKTIKPIFVTKQVETKVEIEIEVPCYFKYHHACFAITEQGIVQASDTAMFITENDSIFYDSTIAKVLTYEKCERNDFYKAMIDFTANLNKKLEVIPDESKTINF